MERMLNFEVAKKLAKPSSTQSGLILKSVSGDSTKASFLISTGGKEGNDRVRAVAADYRMRTGDRADLAIRGKSVEITLEGENVLLRTMDLASGFSFINEDANEVIEFFRRYAGCGFKGELFEPVGLDADEGAFRIRLSLVCDSEIPDEEIYQYIMPALGEYNMGIVKGNTDV